MKFDPRSLVLVLAIACSVACGGPKVVVVHPQVAVAVSPRNDALPFDPEAARLTAAAEQLAKLAGQRVRIDLDAAFFSGDPSSFQEALGQTMENLARDLDALEKRGSSASNEKMQLAGVELRYVAGLPRDEVQFDPSSKILRIRGGARAGALVERGVLASELRTLNERQLADRFTDANVEKVAPGERRAYFDSLRRGVGRPARAQEQPLSDSWEARRILAVLRLHQLAGDDAELRTESHRWLLGEISWFTRAYFHRLAEAVEAAEGSAFRRAERAFGGWMVSAYPRASNEDALKIVEGLFPRLPENAREVELWPGVDRFAFALTVVDAWRNAGHPAADDRKLRPAEGYLVCVRSITASGASTRARCDDTFVRWAVATEARRKLLAKALIDRRDPRWTDQVFQAIRMLDRGTNSLQLVMLRAVEPNQPVWSSGLRQVAKGAVQSEDRQLLEEAQRMWLQYPSPQRRGSVLNLLVHLDYYGRGNVDWRGFANAFDAKISEAELKSYLAESPSTSIAHVRLLWPALDTKFDRARVLEPALGAFLDASAEGKVRELPRPYDVINELFGTMCMHKDDAELRALGAYLKGRAAKHPGEPYGQFANYGNPNECKKPPPPARNEAKLVPAKQRGIRPVTEDQ